VKDSLVTAASVQMRAVILSYRSGYLKGVLHSRYLDKPYEFVSLVQMIDKMEAIFDAKGFPEAFVSPRMFGASGRGNIKNEAEEADDMRVAIDEVGTLVEPDQGGSKCTFEINVKFRQNATWQGQILWVEKNLKQNFRSVLEMLKLMDEALTDPVAQSEPIKWDDTK